MMSGRSLLEEKDPPCSPGLCPTPSISGPGYPGLFCIVTFEVSYTAACPAARTGQSHQRRAGQTHQGPFLLSFSLLALCLPDLGPSVDTQLSGGAHLLLLLLLRIDLVDQPRRPDAGTLSSLRRSKRRDGPVVYERVAAEGTSASGG